MRKDCVLLITNKHVRRKLPALQFRPTRVAVFFCAYCRHSVFATRGVRTLLIGHADRADRKPVPPERDRFTGIETRWQANRSNAEALGLADRLLYNVCYQRLRVPVAR